MGWLVYRARYAFHAYLFLRSVGAPRGRALREVAGALARMR